MTIRINNSVQPAVVEVTTELTPAHFGGRKTIALLPSMFDEKCKVVDFTFGLSTSGEVQLTSKFIAFVGNVRTKKLGITVPLTSVASSVEDAKDILGEILPKAEALEAQIVADYDKRKEAASRITVVEEAAE